ncbi:MAG: phytase, partial [Xanthomonadales bacterium]|nr:phytase [Xanthomonadales bacterium]
MKTMQLVGNEPNSSVLVSDAAGTFVVGSAALGGIEVYDLAGKRLGATPAGEVASVDVSYGVLVRGQPTTVLAAIDTTTNSLRFYAMAGAALTEIGARAVPLGFAAEGVCLYVNPRDRDLYAFVVGDGGEVDQHLVYVDAQGRLDARQVRRIGVPSPLTQCVADSMNATVYAAEEGVGIWRFSADPESDVAAALVDSPGRGHLEEEVGGVALYDGGDGARWLLASDASAGRINVYDRDDDARYLGSFTVGIPGESDPVEEPGPLHATGIALGSGIDHGLLLVADEGGLNYKALSMADIATALGLAPGTPQSAQSIAAAPLAVVTATAETVPVPSYGDAADDPAIWANPTDPALS